MSVIQSTTNLARTTITHLDALAPRLTPLFDLAVRLGLAWIFWKSGLTKIQSWDSTVLLFEYEYAVPLLPPAVAAFLGTAVELSMPVLLTLGLAARFAAFVLFAFNIIAVVSYPSLSIIGIADHVWWGALFLIPIFRGPGTISVDHLIRQRFFGRT